MKYVYYVVYEATSNGDMLGKGNCEVHLDYPLDSGKRINKMSEDIKMNNHQIRSFENVRICVLNFIHLRNEDKF
jgi:hypothetical protein